MSLAPLVQNSLLRPATQRRPPGYVPPALLEAQEAAKAAALPGKPRAQLNAALPNGVERPEGSPTSHTSLSNAPAPFKEMPPPPKSDPVRLPTKVKIDPNDRFGANRLGGASTHQRFRNLSGDSPQTSPMRGRQTPNGLKTLDSSDYSDEYDDESKSRHKSLSKGSPANSAMGALEKAKAAKEGAKSPSHVGARAGAAPPPLALDRAAGAVGDFIDSTVRELNKLMVSTAKPHISATSDADVLAAKKLLVAESLQYMQALAAFLDGTGPNPMRVIEHRGREAKMTAAFLHSDDEDQEGPQQTAKEDLSLEEIRKLAQQRAEQKMAAKQKAPPAPKEDDGLSSEEDKEATED